MAKEHYGSTIWLFPHQEISLSICPGIQHGKRFQRTTPPQRYRKAMGEDDILSTPFQETYTFNTFVRKGKINHIKKHYTIIAYWKEKKQYYSWFPHLLIEGKPLVHHYSQTTFNKTASTPTFKVLRKL